MILQSGWAQLGCYSAHWWSLVWLPFSGSLAGASLLYRLSACPSFCGLSCRVAQGFWECKSGSCQALLRFRPRVTTVSLYLHSVIKAHHRPSLLARGSYYTRSWIAWNVHWGLYVTLCHDTCTCFFSPKWGPSEVSVIAMAGKASCSSLIPRLAWVCCWRFGFLPLQCIPWKNDASRLSEA